jgi:hypothetical protein
MKKEWKKTGNYTYALVVNDRVIGAMERDIKSADHKAIFKTGKEEFTVRRTRIWQTSLEITDSTNSIIAILGPEKWYSSASTLEYKNRKYKLVVRNNPLAEFAILEHGQTLLAYGLSTGTGRPGVKITNPENQDDFLFDFLLWYLFLPVISEQAGESMTFLMLLTA